MNLNSYIESVPLAEPETMHAGAALEAAEPAEEVSKEDMNAAVNAGSILTFVDQLNAQDKDDVLFSTQFAQRAASAKADRFLEVAKWYREYIEWLETLGWVVPQFGFSEYKLGEGEMTMDAAALKIIGAIATGGKLTILNKALEVLGGMAGDSKQLTLFDFHSSVEFGGNFQMGEVQKAENGSLSLALGAFHYKSVDNRKGFLFFRWGKKDVNFWGSAQSVTLNQTLYNQVRDTVANAIGEGSKTLIAGMKLS